MQALYMCGYHSPFVSCWYVHCIHKRTCIDNNMQVCLHHVSTHVCMHTHAAHRSQTEVNGHFACLLAFRGAYSFWANHSFLWISLEKLLIQKCHIKIKGFIGSMDCCSTCLKYQKKCSTSTRYWYFNDLYCPTLSLLQGN